MQVHADTHTHTRTNTLMHTHRLPLSTSERDVKREAEEGGGGPRAEGRRRPPDGRGATRRCLLPSRFQEGLYPLTPGFHAPASRTEQATLALFEVAKLVVTWDSSSEKLNLPVPSRWRRKPGPGKASGATGGAEG